MQKPSVSIIYEDFKLCISISQIEALNCSKQLYFSLVKVKISIDLYLVGRMVQELARELVIGGFYRHFKNKLYQVKGIAYHSETKEKMVVYQAMYGDYSLYVRPYDMFLSEVDHAKYPDVTQKYRFQETTPEEFEAQTIKQAEFEAPVVKDEPVSMLSDVKSDSDNDTASKEIGHDNSVMSDGKEAVELDLLDNDEEKPDKILMDFLDIDTYQEKLKYIDIVRDRLDDKIIDAMAASLDVEVPEGSLDKRYQSLKQVISAHAKYECTRLR